MPEPTFVPVAPYQGRRGFDRTPTRRLRALLDRYRRLGDDAGTDPAVRAYSRVVVREVRAELARRQDPPRPVAAA